MTRTSEDGARKKDRPDDVIEAHAEEPSTSAPEDEEPSSKKERVLHTRVPAVLERELKRLADNLRVPVSNLVRAVLEDAVAVADAAGENVEQRLKTFARGLEEERDRLKRRVQRDPLDVVDPPRAGDARRSPSVDEVYAFQSVKLALPAACARCEKRLERGDSANLGLTDKPRPPSERVLVCDDCLPDE